MYTLDLAGRTGVVFGVANQRSLAWAIAQQLHAAGARLVFTYAGERLKEKVESLAGPLEGSMVVDCDVTRDEDVARVFRQVGDRFGKVDYLVHSVAFANKEDLEGDFINTSRAGFHLAMDISAYSLVRIAREAVPWMEKDGGSIVTLTYNASQRVVPSYNVMGSAKAALEHEVRQLAYELGPKRIRVNAISAGPVNTLSARGISGFLDMLHVSREKAPLRRNIEPDEVGRAALFLLSDMASGITGEVLYVDAGYNIMGT
ncbi:MAG TPA: enoyl-ACP reductase [Candidatus Polarisedimenticolia bacterium]|nr:enoyl-ACP reductase [Candidatus Polarisedimenticolia bacterium]